MIRHNRQKPSLLRPSATVWGTKHKNKWLWLLENYISLEMYLRILIFFSLQNTIYSNREDTHFCVFTSLSPAWHREQCFQQLVQNRELHPWFLHPCIISSGYHLIFNWNGTSSKGIQNYSSCLCRLVLAEKMWENLKIFTSIFHTLYAYIVRLSALQKKC